MRPTSGRYPALQRPLLAHPASERHIVVGHLANDVFSDSQGGRCCWRWCVTHKGHTRLMVNDKVINKGSIAVKSLSANARP